MKEAKIYLPNELYEELKNEANKRNTSLNQLIIEKLTQQQVSDDGLKQIILHYDGKCVKCGKALFIGQKAFYDKQNKKLLCIQCFYNANKNEVKRLVEICVALAKEGEDLVCYHNAPKGIKISGVHVCEACKEIKAVKNKAKPIKPVTKWWEQTNPDRDFNFYDLPYPG